MKLKHLTILTLVFAMMVALVGAVSAQDDTNGRPDKRGGRGFFNNSTIITDATGLTADELRDAVRDGSTIADLIEANGGEVDAVIADLVAEATSHITARVEAGYITQERADEKLETLEEHITERINGTFERPAMGERDGRRGGRRGFGGNNSDDTDTTETEAETS